jgi:hypothetical protein
MTWRSFEDDEKRAPLPCAISGTGEGSGGGRSEDGRAYFRKRGQGEGAGSQSWRLPRQPRVSRIIGLNSHFSGDRRQLWPSAKGSRAAGASPAKWLYGTRVPLQKRGGDHDE